MARKKRSRIASSTRTTDEKLIEKVQEIAPELLTTVVSDDALGRVVDRLLEEESPEPIHFYCRKCGQYHLKTHSHLVSK